MKKTHAALAGVTGAGLMYLFDPNLGRRRRARLLDKGTHISRVAGRGMSTTANDIGHRVQGAFAKGVRALRREEVTDTILLERVRANLGRLVSNPGAIDVDVRNGSVTLSGPVLQDEYRPLLKKIQRIYGVRFIDDRLIRRWPSSVSGPQDTPSHSSRRAAWHPAKRALAIAGGLGAALFGANRRKTLGWLLTGAGVTSAACGISKTSSPSSSKPSDKAHRFEKAGRYAN